MDKLAPDQRNHYYLIEAGRTGIHKPLLAALHRAQRPYPLADGETGLGVVPIHHIDLAQVDTFGGQVRFAANTLRCLTQRLIDQGWASTDLWNTAAGCYADRFLGQVAQGYTPSAHEQDAAQLESCDGEALRQAYLEDWATGRGGAPTPRTMAQLDPTLLAFVERVPPNYGRLEAQRQALVEAARIWQQQDTAAQVYGAMQVPVVAQIPDETVLDQALLEFTLVALRDYAGYPHQREALLRLVQIWHRCDSREAAIALLLTRDPFAHAINLPVIDAALMAVVQTIPTRYRGQGEQRFALTEGYRQWFDLGSRNAALQRLGVNPDDLVAQADHPDALMATAQTLDRALLDFVQNLPATYTETEPQRETLIRLVQLWRGMENRTATVQSLLEDVRRMERAAPTSPDAMPIPLPALASPRPPHWTPDNLQLAASMIPGGHFTWAEATSGGVYMPRNQATVDAMIRIAQLAQQARNRLDRPFMVTLWYHPVEAGHSQDSRFHSRHSIGDAIDVYCPGLTGNQVYWFLDPWWPGGLGRYRHYPHLVHVDARPERARWIHE